MRFLLLSTTTSRPEQQTEYVMHQQVRSVYPQYDVAVEACPSRTAVENDGATVEINLKETDLFLTDRPQLS